MRKAFSNFLFAPVLIVISVSLLGWNEGRAVRTERALNEGQRSVVALEDSVDGALVHTTGAVTVTDPLTDSVLGIERNGLRLVRNVEMYQWRRRSTGQDNSYEYRPEWSGTLLNSQGYPAGYENPARMPLQPDSMVAAEASLSGLTLSTDLLQRLSGLEPVELNDAELATVSSRLELEHVEQADGALYLPYGFGSAAAPQIGDVRLTLRYAPTGTYSAVARRSGDLLEPVRGADGVTIGMLRSGNHTAQALFDQALAQNTGFTIAMRVLGFVLCFAAFRLLFRPLTVLTGWVPVLGRLAHSGVSLVAACLAFGIASGTIVVAWLFYRPLIALPFLAVCVALIVLGVNLIRRVRRAGSPASVAPAAAAATALTE